MEISAKVILDSECEGNRLTTYLLKSPRMQHAEFMTHRAFSRNASSSRAIPVERLVDMALEDPAFFVELGSNKKGMQAGRRVAEHIASQFETEWKFLANVVAKYCKKWGAPVSEGGFGLHKQIANRAMEPWHHIGVLFTTTDSGLNNFFGLRDHHMADPNIQELAIQVKKAQAGSIPKTLAEGEWHIPFITQEEEHGLFLEVLLKASAARAARTSYMNHDGSAPNIQKDIELHDDLVSQVPMHASPLEHAAVATPGVKLSNFEGFTSYRDLRERGVNVNSQSAIRLLLREHCLGVWTRFNSRYNGNSVLGD